MALKPQTREIYKYIKEHEFENITAADVAHALDLRSTQSVNGAFTALQRKNLGYRVEDIIYTPDQPEREKRVNYLRLTDEGRKVNFDIVEAL